MSLSEVKPKGGYMFYARITKDHVTDDVNKLCDGRDPLASRVNLTWGEWNEGKAQGVELLQVRLLDDDRELYYEAVATDEALEVIYEWARHDAGVTILQVLKNDVSQGKVWQDVIG